MKRYAVIMAGGAGERFWPLSRIKMPKHLWNVAGGDKCLLAQTFERVSKIVPEQNIIIVTNAEQVENMLKMCPNLSADRVISEPIARDTTAAVGLGALLVKKFSNGEESSFAVFPSDHVIADVDGFKATIESAFNVAESSNALVTIGIEPTFPATGYGYIRRAQKLKNSFGDYFNVSRFFEKPNFDRAKSYLDSGEFYWNAGMFVWKTTSILDAIARYAPSISAVLGKIDTALAGNVSLDEALKKYYPEIEKISIDFSVMEHSDNVAVVPSRFDWDDVGSWSAVERHNRKDAAGNVERGELYSKDAENCIVFDAAGRATALLGVKNLIVVHSADATLVCDKNCAEDLKTLVRTLPDKLR